MIVQVFLNILQQPDVGVIPTRMINIDLFTDGGRSQIDDFTIVLEGKHMPMPYLSHQNSPQLSKMSIDLKNQQVR